MHVVMNRYCDLSTEMIRHDTCLLSEPAHETIRAAGDFTEQMASEMIIRSTQTVQQAVQSGAEIAVRMTEYSAANINTIVKSNADLVGATRTMSRDWMRFAQEGIERGFDWFRCLLQYRALSILPKSRKKPCALVLMPCSVTQRGESVRMADEVTRTTATESSVQQM
jgi:hypothetical protein